MNANTAADSLRETWSEASALPRDSEANIRLHRFRGVVSQQRIHRLNERKGRIINMGSLGGIRPWASNAHYCASKAAVHMLTKVMAKALAPEIAVNCVAPGMIDLGEKSAAAFLKKIARQTPMQRNGASNDVTDAVMFFATAPHFITGQVLAVDGGLGL